MKPSIKRMSCVLLVVLWLPPNQVQPMQQLIGGINLNLTLPETIILGSQNTVIRE